MAFFLYEKGFREMDFNFSWGYMYGIFFAFVGALLVLLRATANADTRKRRIVVAVQWMAYLWHLVCGVYYFWGFLQGAMYYWCKLRAYVSNEPHMIKRQCRELGFTEVAAQSTVFLFACLPFHHWRHNWTKQWTILIFKDYIPPFSTKTMFFKNGPFYRCIFSILADFGINSSIFEKLLTWKFTKV